MTWIFFLFLFSLLIKTNTANNQTNKIKMPFTSLATITCIDNAGTRRDIQLLIRWEDANEFDNRMFNIQRNQDVIAALGDKIDRPVTRVLFANYCLQNFNRCRPDVVLS